MYSVYLSLKCKLFYGFGGARRRSCRRLCGMVLGHRLLSFAQLNVALVGAGTQLALNTLVHGLGDDGLDLLCLVELGLLGLNGSI